MKFLLPLSPTHLKNCNRESFKEKCIRQRALFVQNLKINVFTALILDIFVIFLQPEDYTVTLKF